MNAAMARIPLVGMTACDLGVLDAGHPGGLGGGEVVAVDPERHGAHEHQRRRDDRQVHACGLGRAGLLRRDDAAVEVVREGRRDEPEHEDHRQERDDEVDPGQVEDEEADVEAELGVRRAEVGAVAPQQEGVPLRGRREAGEEPDGERRRDRRGPAHRLDELAVVLHRLRVG